jgi:PTH1 family peptidyl-tRNA hydrolase
MDYYNVSDEDILVIYDDLDLPIGRIRLRQKGSAGGHNGIKSLIAHLGTNEFNRIKVGIDRPQNGKEVVSYVLSTFPKNTHEDMLASVRQAAEASLYWASGHDFVNTMNQFNTKK